MKKMNKRIVVLLTALMLMAGTMNAQIFIADDEFEGTMRLEEDEFVLFVPVQGHEGDQFYAPMGSGLLLTGMAGAYLLTKRKKQK
jgi:hypothetical protein